MRSKAWGRGERGVAGSASDHWRSDNACFQGELADGD